MTSKMVDLTDLMHVKTIQYDAELLIIQSITAENLTALFINLPY